MGTFFDIIKKGGIYRITRNIIKIIKLQLIRKKFFELLERIKENSSKKLF